MNDELIDTLLVVRRALLSDRPSLKQAAIAMIDDIVGTPDKPKPAPQPLNDSGHVDRKLIDGLTIDRNPVEIPPHFPQLREKPVMIRRSPAPVLVSPPMISPDPTANAVVPKFDDPAAALFSVYRNVVKHLEGPHGNRAGWIPATAESGPYTVRASVLKAPAGNPDCVTFFITHAALGDSVVSKRPVMKSEIKSVVGSSRTEDDGRSMVANKAALYMPGSVQDFRQSVSMDSAAGIRSIRASMEKDDAGEPGE